MAETGTADRLLVAIDTTDLDAARALASALKGEVGGVKLGLEFYTAHGPDGVRAVADAGAPVFLDLKFDDIPNTVGGAVRACGPLEPFMLTVHALGGPAMLRAAMAAAFRLGEASGAERPRVVAVTVLTSMDATDLAALGLSGTVSDAVGRLAGIAQDCGVDGVVSSAHEVERLRAQCGAEFRLVVPGIRPAWSSTDDQKRIVTPGEAVALGADYLVVGRPITRADEPVEAARRIVAEMAASGGQA
jgi:orotidine-5'-phosphate decarboxylase